MRNHKIVFWKVCICAFACLLINQSLAYGGTKEVTVEHDSEGRLIVQPPVLEKNMKVVFKSMSSERNRYIYFPSCKTKGNKFGPDEPCVFLLEPETGDNKTDKKVALEVVNFDKEKNTIDIKAVKRNIVTTIKTIDGTLKYKVYEDVDDNGITEKLSLHYMLNADGKDNIYGRLKSAYNKFNDTLPGDFIDLKFEVPEALVQKESKDLQEYLDYLSKKLKLDKASVEKSITQIDLLFSGTKEDPAKYEKILVVGRALLAFKEELSSREDVVSKDKSLFDKHYKSEEKKVEKYDYRALFEGELLAEASISVFPETGRGRKVIAYDADGRYIGGVTSEYFHTYDKDYVYIYVQTKAIDKTQFDLDVAQEPYVDAEVGKFAVYTSNLTKPQDKNKEELVINHAAVYELRRVTQGERFKAESMVTLTIKGKEATEKDAKVISKTKILVRGSYTYGLNTGIAISNNERKEYSKNSTNVITEKCRETVAPILVLTRYWRPRSYSGDELTFMQKLTPNPFIGFRIDNPGNDMFVGVSIEPVRGVNILLGANYGKRTVLFDGQRVGDDIGANNVSTKESYKTDAFVGVTFDVNLFVKSAVELVGF